MAGHHFGPFELDVASFELRRHGEAVPLQKKAFDVLLYLVQHPTRVVDRDELLARVWAGTAVTPTSLTRTVSELRRALGETPDHDHGFIRTVHGRGYRFVGCAPPN